MAEGVETRPRIPAIRTMRSDVAEFLKSEKPSLVSLLAQELKEKDVKAIQKISAGRRVVFWTLGGMALAAIGGGIYYFFFAPASKPPTLVGTSTSLPQPPFFFETSATKTIAKDASALRSVLTQTAASPPPPGQMSRLVVLINTPQEGQKPLETNDLFSLFGIQFQDAFLSSAAGPIQFFTYAAQTTSRLGFLGQTRDPDRTLRGLLDWEPSMLRDLDFLFAGAIPPVNLGGFQDHTYQNIDFRFLNLDPANNLGLGYAVFPGRGLFVIATSMPAIQATISRVLQTR